MKKVFRISMVCNSSIAQCNKYRLEVKNLKNSQITDLERAEHLSGQVMVLNHPCSS